MKIYQIDSSARKEGSTSRALAKKLLDKIKKPGDEVIYRDLDDEMLFVSGLTESGMKIKEKDQTEEHKKMFELSNKLVTELKESDIIIISLSFNSFTSLSDNSNIFLFCSVLSSSGMDIPDSVRPATKSISSSKSL